MQGLYWPWWSLIEEKARELGCDNMVDFVWGETGWFTRTNLHHLIDTAIPLEELMRKWTMRAGFCGRRKVTVWVEKKPGVRYNGPFDIEVPPGPYAGPYHWYERISYLANVKCNAIMDLYYRHDEDIRILELGKVPGIKSRKRHDSPPPPRIRRKRETYHQKQNASYQRAGKKGR